MSFEELGGPVQSVDIGNQGNESGANSITNAMREAVAEQERQGKIIAGKIAGSKTQGSAYAKFLIFLIGQLQSEELISILYKLFFTTKDPYHGTTYIRKTSNYPVLIGMFVPFFREKITEYKMQSLYAPIYDPSTQITPTNYLHYLKKLAHTMHDNIALDQQVLLQCIMEIYKEFHVVDPKALTEEKYEQVYSLIQHELYQ